MDIKLQNTLGNKNEIFKSLKSDEVSMYHCGPTVYHFVHIGNLRHYLLADILRRTFEYFGLSVKQVINITDVGHLVGDGDEGEDKVEKTAKATGKTAAEIAEFYENAFHKDLRDFNIRTEDTVFPKASEHIKEQIEIIKILEEKDFTYQTSDGIYFDTSKFKDYGKLGNINLEGLKGGVRVEIGEKKNPTDFALWKFSGDKKRLQEWESPWGIGFPGWHIECSAMSRKYLGQPFDIHTSGIDHIPTHHNNEIAQSEAAFSVPLANYWLHNEFLSVDGQKMSKSLGNTYTLSDLKKKGIHPLSFRYFLLTSNYRTPTNFTWEAIEGAQNALEKIASEFNVLEGALHGHLLEEFEEAMANDLDTPVALSLLQKATDQETIEKMNKVLGLNILELSKQINQIPEEIMDLVKQRETAREKEDWKTSDDLRDKIESKGFRIMDNEFGSVVQNTLANIAKSLA